MNRTDARLLEELLGDGVIDLDEVARLLRAARRDPTRVPPTATGARLDLTWMRHEEG